MTQTNITITITGEQVREAVKAAGLTWVENHRCGICNSPVGYRINHGNLFYDSNCGCTSYWSQPEPRDWEDAAGWINMQDKPENRVEIAKRFGLVLDLTT